MLLAVSEHTARFLAQSKEVKQRQVRALDRALAAIDRLAERLQQAGMSAADVEARVGLSAQILEEAIESGDMSLVVYHTALEALEDTVVDEDTCREQIAKLLEEREAAEIARVRAATQLFEEKNKSQNLQVDLMLAQAEAVAVRQHFACPDLTPAALGKIAIDASTDDRREQVRLHAARQLSRMLVRALDRDNGTDPIVQDIMRMLSQYT